tara:strand:- start:3934 stop:4404 length:471 start_codon:yes stop_codon:yes gene_type:complete
MQEVPSQQVGSKPKLKNGNWEIILTDPSLNKFNFGNHITDKYITTDIISPFGEKSILYNTVSKEANSPVVVSLNFEDIDQTRIATLAFKASKTFFQNWKVFLIDNRTNQIVKVTKEIEFHVSPIIELNKLSNMGFVEGAVEKGKSFFEMHLQRIVI